MPDNKTDAFELEFVNFLFKATAISGLGANLYVCLFTGSPHGVGTEDQANISNEGYSGANGYANTGTGGRQAVVRSAAGWTVTQTGGTTEVKNASAITFPTCTGGSSVVDWGGLAKGATAGVADLVIAGPLSSSLTVTNGVQPQFAANNLVFEEL